MAIQRGSIQFTGGLKDIRAYYDKRLNICVISGKGGASKEMIHNHPSFARTRENMNEFIVCGKWAAQMRRTLFCMGHLFQGSYFSNIVSVSKQIQKHDDKNPKGYRNIELSKTAPLLSGINFNSYQPLHQVLAHPFEVLFSDDKSTISLNFHDFVSSRYIKSQNRISRFRFSLVIAQLPDWVWSDKWNCYQPVADDMENLTVCSSTEWIQNSTDCIDINLSASFAKPALQIPGTTVVVTIALELSCNTTNLSSVPDANCFGSMEIVKCYV